jgi:hypothetical protein
MPRSPKPSLLARSRTRLGRWLRPGWFDRLPFWDWAEGWLDVLVPVGDSDRRRRSVQLDLERLEIRWLMTNGISESMTRNALPFAITAGPDGNLWYTEGPQRNLSGAVNVGRMTTAGNLIGQQDLSLTTVSGQLTSPFVAVGGITAGPNGHLWVDGIVSQSTNSQTYAVAEIDTSGTVVHEFQPSATTNSVGYIGGIVAGPDGNLWLGAGMGVTLPNFYDAVVKVTVLPPIMLAA